MADQFEKFMRNNRQDFDLFEPSPDMWDKIEKKVHPSKIRKLASIKTMYKVAAAVVVLAVGSYVFFKPTTPVANQLAEVQKEAVSSELREIEVYYTREINQKMDELKPVFASYPGLDEEIEQDMTTLDSIYTDLKKDLKDNVANREVIEAMIQNYRTRLEILEELIRMLEPEEEQVEESGTSI